MIEVADFRERLCPPADVVMVDPPYGMGKLYGAERESVPFEAWVNDLHAWAKGHCGWLLVIGPWTTMQTWLSRVPAYDQMLVWHKTFVNYGRGKGGRKWTESASPILLYDFGGAWLGSDWFADVKKHNVIAAHSSMGDSGRRKKLGINIQKHPGVTGTQIGKYALPNVLPPKGTLVDPMVGCGSILVSGLRLGATVLGYELNPTYAEAGNAWLTAEAEAVRAM